MFKFKPLHKNHPTLCYHCYGKHQGKCGIMNMLNRDGLLLDKNPIKFLLNCVALILYTILNKIGLI